MIVDVFVAGILLVSGILAFFRGFVRETLTVAGWIGAALVTYYGYAPVRPAFASLISSDLIADGATIGTLFLVSLVILTVLTHIVSGKVRGSALGQLDSALGFVFGALRGVVLIALAYLGATVFWDESDFPVSVVEAKTLPLVRVSADILSRLIPEDALPARHDVENQVNGAVNNAVQGLATDKLDEMVKEVEAEERLRRLTQPQPEQPPAAEQPAPGQPVPPPSYPDPQRQEMQRLIETTQ